MAQPFDDSCAECQRVKTEADRAVRAAVSHVQGSHAAKAAMWALGNGDVVAVLRKLDTQVGGGSRPATRWGQ